MQIKYIGLENLVHANRMSWFRTLDDALWEYQAVECFELNDT